MTSTLTNAFMIVMAINVFLFLGQVAVLELNPSGTEFYNCDNTTLARFESSSCDTSTYTIRDTDPTADLPSGETSVSPDTGVVYTDSFVGLKSWFLDNTGIGYLVDILSAPSNLMKAMGLPDAVSFAIGAFWYALTLFLLVAFLFGREV